MTSLEHPSVGEIKCECREGDWNMQKGHRSQPVGVGHLSGLPNIGCFGYQRKEGDRLQPSG